MRIYKLNYQVFFIKNKVSLLQLKFYLGHKEGEAVGEILFKSGWPKSKWQVKR